MDTYKLDLELQVVRLEKKLALYEKLERKILHENPDKHNTYFICGESSQYDKFGFPDRVHICNAYGSDIIAVYKRLD